MARRTRRRSHSRRRTRRRSGGFKPSDLRGPVCSPPGGRKLGWAECAKAVAEKAKAAATSAVSHGVVTKTKPDVSWIKSGTGKRRRRKSRRRRSKRRRSRRRSSSRRRRRRRRRSRRR